MFSLSSLTIIEVLSTKLIVVAFKLSLFLFCFCFFLFVACLLSDKMLQMYLDVSPTVLLCKNLLRELRPSFLHCIGALGK